MKTIRQNCFETNSSSTHALILCRTLSNSGIDTTFIPNANGEVHINTTYGGNCQDNDPWSKSKLLLYYAETISDESLYNRIVSVIESTAGVKVTTERTVYDNGKTKLDRPAFKPLTEEEKQYAIRDKFYKFTCEYGNGSVEGFVEAIESILNNDTNIKNFIFCSKNGIELNAYYDG